MSIPSAVNHYPASILFRRWSCQAEGIKGSDTGIGHALAKYLDNLGFVVFAGVLNKDGRGAEELRRTCSQRLSLLQLDITNATQVKEAYRKVSEKVQNTGLWGVVNNAGILGFPADGELLPMSTYRQCMEVNFFGAVEVSKTFLPLLRKSQGRLVNVSSMAGGIPLPRYAAYGASKAALSMFSGVMRQELSKWGIKVAAVHPSGFRTGIQGTSDLWDKQEKELMENLSADTRQDYGSVPAHPSLQRRRLLTAEQLVLHRTLQKEKTEESVAMGIVDVPGGQREKYVSPGRRAFLS
ncbi:17-beta-hydroxysteroid dehydrogenase type 2 [Mycteria americana]|uniref:17-beta-hydroxysteroid dehydrogenase type 2 n=1 Tax=Mycteria americana TaxID=33587 RepID=UPI003F58C063